VSIDDLTAFFSRLQEDEALRGQALALEQAAASDRLEGLCRLAQEHGFDVTPDDLRAAHAVPAVAELDDEALKSLPAGGGCSAVGSVAFGQGAEFNPMG
jgi:predicted ribosomally synthesized peptide with nif11-like leader